MATAIHDTIPEQPTEAEEMPEAQWFVRGEWIVEHRLREEWTNLTDLTAAVTPYLEHCRRKAYVTGTCDPDGHGCCDSNLEPDAMGRLVCFRTRRPCMRLRLRAIIDMWSGEMATGMTERKSSTELVPEGQAKQLLEIERLRKESAKAIAEAEDQGNDVLRLLIVAKSMQRLRVLLTDELMEDVMQLQNTPLGFDTDKRETGYPVKVVRDVAITALLQGFRLVGNEINIIAGRMYPAKAGKRRLCQEWPGLTDLHLDLGVPDIRSSGALVSAVARWKVNGRQYQLDFSAPKSTAPCKTKWTTASRCESTVVKALTRFWGRPRARSTAGSLRC